jgi:three-Cys-motif partner protein
MGVAGPSIQVSLSDKRFMPRVGRAHFDQYTEQNRVKHAILSRYFEVYLTALRRTADAFHYVDGFAGPGTYADGEPGSPIQVLALLANQTLPASASFVEEDAELCATLGTTVASSAAATLFDKPLVECARFSESIDVILKRPIYARYKNVATFAFVDPCGVNGLRMTDLGKIIRMRFGECLVFWNYDGLSRWVGGIFAGTHERTRLNEFFGDEQLASETLDRAKVAPNTALKEDALRQGYVRAIRELSGASFVLPFRFQSDARKRTSHYLIHLSNHPLAFRLMKEVMWRASTVESFGTFEFVGSASEAQGKLFDTGYDQARGEVLAALRVRAEPAKTFTQDWPLRPHDLLVADQYKKVVLDLERDGDIEILDRATGALKPAGRRLRAGKVTLGESCLVRLKESDY